jgi:hypothetical protein
MKRRFGDEALISIGRTIASTERGIDFLSTPEMRPTYEKTRRRNTGIMRAELRELRAISAMIRAAGSMREIELVSLIGNFKGQTNWGVVKLCRAILRVREIEARRKP